MERGDKASMRKFWGSGFLTLGHVKDVVLLCLLVVVTWKLINSDISIKLESFSFTDLLSVLLAFFAIALSAAFYFKATDTSNQFYDNSYKFTKEMSEILGRIEAGFGEKLQNINEGYSGIKDTLDKMPLNIEEMKLEVKKDEEQVNEIESKINQALVEILEKGGVSAEDRESYLRDIDKLRKEVENAKSELESSKEIFSSVVRNDMAIPMPLKFIIRKYFSGDVAVDFSLGNVREAKRKINTLLKIEEGFLGPVEIERLTNYMVIKDRALTDLGLNIFRKVLG